MKKITILFSVALLSIVSVKAQSTSFGIKGGVNANTFYLKSDGASSTRYSLTKPGFHVGGVADIKVSENFSVQPQLLFNMKGGKIKISGSESDFNFWTLDVPVNLLYHYNGFFIGGGPNLSYGLSAKLKQTGSAEKDLYEEGALSTGTKFDRFEFGVNATMGYRCPSGLVISTNFTPGLSDIMDETTATTNTKAHNSYWGFSIGYMFGGGGVKKK